MFEASFYGLLMKYFVFITRNMKMIEYLKCTTIIYRLLNKED